MTECCNGHDLCYDTCNSGDPATAPWVQRLRERTPSASSAANAGKTSCDVAFEQCMGRVCAGRGNMPGCLAVVATMRFAVDNLACSSYLESQGSGCSC